MQDDHTAAWMPLAIGAILFVVLSLGAVTFLFLARPSPAPAPATVSVPLSSVGASAGRAPSRGIDFTLTPRTATRQTDGKYIIEVEVDKNDDWDWQTFDVSKMTILLSDHADSKTSLPAVRLLSPLPTNPVPDHFVLRFETDAIDASRNPSMRIAVEVQATQNLGTSSGNASKTTLIRFNELPAPTP